MKRRTSVFMALLIVGAVGAALFLGFSGSMSADEGCKSGVVPVAHQASIRSGHVTNGVVTAKLCDTLTITNQDKAAREIAFGPHQDHVPYDGVAERVLSAGQSFTITLNQTGSFRWHDHLHDEVQGYFTVSR